MYKPHGGKKFGAKKPWDRGAGGRGFSKSALHPATCSQCHEPCEVPFRPDGSRPVLCRKCFKREDSFAEVRRPAFEDKRSFRSDDRRDDRERAGGSSPDMLKTINAKLDTILKRLDEIAD